MKRLRSISFTQYLMFFLYFYGKNTFPNDMAKKLNEGNNKIMRIRKFYTKSLYKLYRLGEVQNVMKYE